MTPKADHPARNRGQAALVASGRSLSAVADLVGVSRETVRRWRSGAKTPGGSAASTLESELGIPADAWRQEPDVLEAPVLPEAQPADDRAAALERVRALLGRLSDMRAVPGLTVAARLELERCEVSAVRELRHLEAPPALTEKRILASAPWRRVQGAIVTAIGTLPEEWRQPVRDALIRELRKLEGDA